MTKQELEKEARKLYRSVYAACIGNGYTHNDAGIEANEAYISFFDRFQSKVTQPAPEPAENPDKLPEFEGPDWSKAPEWANWCAQDKDGAVYWYGKKPQTAIKQWSPMKSDVEFFAECYQPANWETAIWQRPTE